MEMNLIAHYAKLAIDNCNCIQDDDGVPYTAACETHIAEAMTCLVAAIAAAEIDAEAKENG
jgi:hypothetical protein